jgi:hypothetical protein
VIALLAAQDMATLHVVPALTQIVVATGLFAVLVRVIMRLVPADDSSADPVASDAAEPNP